MTTGSPFAHAAVEVDGILYDASERRATFGPSREDLRSRQRVEFTFVADLTPWLRQMHGLTYTWRGIPGWLFIADDPRRFYCFGAAWGALRAAEMVPEGHPPRLNGDHLYAACRAAELPKREVGETFSW